MNPARNALAMPTELGSSDSASSGLNVLRRTSFPALTSAPTPNSVSLSLFFFSFNEFSTLSNNKKCSTDTQKLIVLYP